MVDQSAPESAQPTRPISSLAIIGLVVALIPMCLPLNLIGCLLGLLALLRISSSGGAMGGAGAAKVAMWGGAIMFALGYWGVTSLADWGQGQVREQGAHAATEFVRAVQDHEYEAARRWWSRSAEPVSDDALQAFAEALERVGRIEQVGIRSVQPVPAGMFQAAWSASMAFVGDDETHRGAGRFDVSAGAASLDDLVRIRRMVISGPDGDITLPATKESTP
jgi:hypothetical protein